MLNFLLTFFFLLSKCLHSLLQDEVKAAGIVRNSSSFTDEECSNTCEDLDNDELTQVFGKEKNAGVRAVGSRISKRQLLHIGVARSKTEGKKKAKEEATSLEDRILSHVDSKFEDFQGIMMSLFSKLSNVSTVPMVTTPSSDIGSYSVHRPTQLAQNLNDVFTTMGVLHSPHSMSTPNDKPPVVICDKFGKELAKGYVVTDDTGKKCHFKPVGKGEKKVYIEDVFEPDAPLWDPPQGGHETLADFVQGGYVIWMDCWLKYV